MCFHTFYKICKCFFIRQLTEAPAVPLSIPRGPWIYKRLNVLCVYILLSWELKGMHYLLPQMEYLHEKYFKISLRSPKLLLIFLKKEIYILKEYLHKIHLNWRETENSLVHTGVVSLV